MLVADIPPSPATGIDLYDLLSQYYRIYFAKRYDEFKPEIRESMVKNIKYFFSQIKNSNELNKDFDKEIISKGLFFLKNDWNDHLYEINRAIDHLRNEHERIDNHLGKRMTEFECNNVCRFYKIYYKYRIAISILSFAGWKQDEYDIPYTFIGAFTRYVDQFKLTELKLD